MRDKTEKDLDGVKFVSLQDEQEIQCTLDYFAKELSSLRESEQYRKALAQKYAGFARVDGLVIDQKLCGFAAYYCNDDLQHIGYLSMIAIDKPHRGLGLGAELLKHVIASCKQNSMESMRLEVRKSNLRAQSFYTKMGFTPQSETDESIYMELCIQN